MTAVGEGFWAGLDKQVADAALRGSVALHGAEKLTRPHISSAAALVRQGPELEPVRMPVAAPEWSGVLDIINGARQHAEAQRDQLLEQAETFDQAVREMHEDAEAIRQQVRVLEGQVQEAKAELERQVAEIQMQSEARVQDILIKANSEIAQARSEAQSAEARAAVAEDWLKRIEEAAASLVPRVETTSVRRAA